MNAVYPNTGIGEQSLETPYRHVSDLLMDVHHNAIKHVLNGT